jgi:hypothetical protein
MHLFRYPGESFGIANLHDCRLISAVLMDTGRKLKITHEPTRDVISGLPKKSPDPIACVVKIKTCPKTSAEIRQRQWIGIDDPNRDLG